MERKMLEEMGLDKEAVDKVMDAHSAGIGRQKKLAEAMAAERDELAARLLAADAALEALAQADVDGMAGRITQLEEELAAAEGLHREETEQRAFAQLLQMEMDAARVKSPAAVAALLPLAEIRADDAPQEALREALAVLKESERYLFAPPAVPPMYAAGTGTAPVGRDAFRDVLGVK